jgi:sterol desaturase/sphingolipid hydroxylase (fatty acid hydroxylase superfamily)
VDQSRVPGGTSHEAQHKDNPNWRSIVSGSFLLWSPNLVWLGFAVLDYFVFPYDLEAAKEWKVGWIARRLAINMFLVYGYVGFWHSTLYFLHWGTRPFNPVRQYRISKVLHNVYYTTLGIVQWTGFEAIVTHCYATGRLPYISDEESFSTLSGFVQFILSMFWVPIWREFHFYFAHRLIHIKVFYKYVHSLHHRNTDVEPFSGLCMHPVEHLFYYACALPSLYVQASPFAFMWNGIHLLLSPAASHSGFEDNWQSDQHHYLHHRFFECNYGTGTFPFDYWFGTFRESLDPKSTLYQGESQEVRMDSVAAKNADAKSTLVGAPDGDQVLFNLICCVAVPLAVAAALQGVPWAAALKVPGLLDNAQFLALAVSVGPLLVGAALIATTVPKALSRPKFAMLYPFHKEPLFGAFGFHVFVGMAVTALPVYHMVHMVLAEPGQGAYFAARAWLPVFR